MSLDTLRQIVALNQRISDSNDRFVTDFKAIIEKLDAGRESMMQHADQLKSMKKPESANCETPHSSMMKAEA